MNDKLTKLTYKFSAATSFENRAFVNKSFEYNIVNQDGKYRLSIIRDGDLTFYKNEKTIYIDQTDPSYYSLDNIFNRKIDLGLVSLESYVNPYHPNVSGDFFDLSATTETSEFEIVPDSIRSTLSKIVNAHFITIYPVYQLVERHCVSKTENEKHKLNEQYMMTDAFVLGRDKMLIQFDGDRASNSGVAKSEGVPHLVTISGVANFEVMMNNGDGTFTTTATTVNYSLDNLDEITFLANPNAQAHFNMGTNHAPQHSLILTGSGFENDTASCDQGDEAYLKYDPIEHVAK